jgi:carboxyl-terminal processing protease
MDKHNVTRSLSQRTTRWMALILFVLMISFVVSPGSSAIAEEHPSALDQVNEIFQLIESYHVSGIGQEDVADAAIRGMISALDDPYTQYMTKSEWEHFQNSLASNYVGIGVRIAEDDEGVFIVEVFAGSPAMSAGLLRGDYITAVEGDSVKGKSLDEIVSSIIGTEGTKVKVTVERNRQARQFELTRKRIRIPVVTSRNFGDGVGYIRLSSFSGDADELFAANLAELNTQGIRSLVVDLRDNPGGLLDSATNIAKQFIKEGTLIHTKDRNGQDRPIVITDGSELSYPVTVLVNENSASASEVLVGALQDYKLATVVGRNTYGKGSVQNIFQLSGGGALKITVQEYLTPHYRQVNHKGLAPDVEVQGEAPQLIDALHRSGLSHMRLSIQKNTMKINDFDVNDSVKIIRKQGKVYVPSRLLASFVEGQIAWNGASRAVEISKGDTVAAFPASSEHIVLVKGSSYIELDRFTEAFPEFQWETQGEALLFDLKKGN